MVFSWCTVSRGEGDNIALKQGCTSVRKHLEEFIRWMVRARACDLSAPAKIDLVDELLGAIERKTGDLTDNVTKQGLLSVRRSVWQILLATKLIKQQFMRAAFRKVQNERETFNQDNQRHSVRVLWTEPDPLGQTRSDRLRVMLTAALLLLCYTGARPGTLFPFDKDTISQSARLKREEKRGIVPGPNLADMKGIQWKVRVHQWMTLLDVLTVIQRMYNLSSCHTRAAGSN